MIRRAAMSVVGVAILSAASAHADEVDCISARYLAAGKYASCEAKVAAKGFRVDKFLKCRQKYAAAWTKLGTKHPGTSCTGPRFVDNGLTVTDNLTQLVWEKKTTAVGSGTNASDRHDVDNTYTWSAGGSVADGTAYTDFLDDLNSTGFAGQHDWRLPTLFEFQTIVATDAIPCGTSGSAACIVDALFLPAKPADHWSSSSDQVDSTIAHGINFYDGFEASGGKFNAFSVRAVRGGS